MKPALAGHAMAMRRLRAGSLQAELDDTGLRTLSYKGVEILRGLSVLVRDADWRTEVPNILAREVNERARRSQSTIRCSYFAGRLVLDLSMVASEGLLVAAARLEATETIMVNRAGFVLLHPPCPQTFRLFHPDGTESQVDFPTTVSPDLVARNFVGMNFKHHDLEVKVELDGGVYETEDQRNWIDASFKSYTPPLSEPTPFRIKPGVPTIARVIVDVRGSARPPAAPKKTPRVEFAPADEHLPEQALILDGTCVPDGPASALVGATGVGALLCRIMPGEMDRMVPQIALLKDRVANIDLELVLESGHSIAAQLATCSEMMRAAGISPRNVLALPDAYLKSYQPEGPWPAGPTPSEAAVAARRAFPDASIGGGMLTNFAEFNRCRPDFSCDYVSHGASAIVHAADDHSVISTLEGLRAVLASGRAIACGRAYRLGLISIGMRSNPYGAEVTDSPRCGQLAMARFDPRHRTLFGAAWAVGAVAATLGHRIASIALAAPVGAFGIIQTEDRPEVPLPSDRELFVYPLFHVISFLARFAGGERLNLKGLPAGCVGVAGIRDGTLSCLIANLADDAVTIRFDRPFSIRVLGSRSVADLPRNSKSLEHQPVVRGAVNLQPFEIGFALEEGLAA